MKNIINFTPHNIEVINSDNEIITITSSGSARCAQTSKIVNSISGISISETEFGEVSGLPEQKNDTMLIVSRLVMAACPDRADLLVPNQLQRDEGGNITHCLSLSRN